MPIFVGIYLVSLQIHNLLGSMGLSRFIYANIHCCQQIMAAETSISPRNEEDTLSARTGALICSLLYSYATGINMYSRYFACCYRL